MKSISDLIMKLISGFPWVRKRALNNPVEFDLLGAKEIITELDNPYTPISMKGLSSSNSAEWSAAVTAGKRWPLLVDALVKIGEPALPELEKALQHPNPNVRISAIHAIGYIGHPSAIDLLLPFVEAKKSPEEGWAMVALGRTRSPRIYETLVAALDDKNIDRKESAILALGVLGDTRALPKLEKIAAADKTLVEPVGRTIGNVAKEAIEKIQKSQYQKAG